MQDHAAILNKYRSTQLGEGWHTAPDDGYLYDHLVYHLREAGFIDELLLLFANPNWMHVRVSQNAYTYDGYINDLQVAWEAAYKEYLEQAERGETPTAFITCFRLSLIRASINSLAGDYPPELLQAAVELGIWTVDRAWSIVKKAPDLEMYAALLATNKLDEERRQELINDGYQRVLHLRDHWQEIEPPWWPPSATVSWFITELVKMLPYLTDSQRVEVLQFDLKLLLGYGWGKAHWSPDIVEQIAPYLKQTQLEKLAHEAEEMFWEDYRPVVFAILVPLFEDDAQRKHYSEKALQLARKLPELSLDNAPKKIAKILTYLEVSAQPDVLFEGFKAAVNSPRNDDKASGMRLLIPHITAVERTTIIQRVLEYTQALDWGMGSGWQLLQLYPYLNAEQQNSVFELLMTMPEWVISQTIELWAKIFVSLSLEQKLRVLNELFSRSENAQLICYPMGILSALPLDIAQNITRKRLEANLKLPDQQNYVEAVAASIPKVVPEQRLRLATWVFERRDASLVGISSFPSFNTKMICAIGQYLSPELLKIAFEEAMALTSDECVRRFTSILPHLGESESQQALDKVVRDFTRHWSDSLHIQLSQLAPALVGQVWVKAIQLALEAILKLEPPQATEARFQNTQTAPSNYQVMRGLFDNGLAYNLRQLAPYLNPQQLDQAFDTLIQRIETDSCRAEGLLGFIKYLKPKQREEAVRLCYESDKQNRFHPVREDLISPIAPYLSEEMKQEALNILYSDKDIVTAIQVVLRLVPYLSSNTRQEALNWAFQNAGVARTDHFWRAEIYARLAAYLDESRREAAIEYSYSDLTSPLLAQAADSKRKIDILKRLVKVSNEPSRFIHTIHQLIADYLTTQHTQKRDYLMFANSQIFSQLDAPIFSPSVHAEIADQIIDVCENWDWL